MIALALLTPSVFEFPCILRSVRYNQPRFKKASRNIPKHVERAVRNRDGNRCRNCGVVTEFTQLDHILPFDLGGPTTVENLQLLCPTCNTSKGNKITCRNCGHWMSPDKKSCSQCEFRLVHTKYSRTVAGRLEKLFHRVGRAVVVSGVALVLLSILAGSFYVYRHLRGYADSDQAATIDRVVNSFFQVSSPQPTNFRVVIPENARNGRVIGGFKVTSGAKVNFYVLSEAQFQQWSGTKAINSSLVKRVQIASARVRQTLRPGTYFLLFASDETSVPSTVAAEFYSKHD